MSNSKRLSQSLNGSWTDSALSSSTGPAILDNSVIAEWVKVWKNSFARDLIDSRVVVVEAETSVEDACDRLTSEDLPCLVVNGEAQPGDVPEYGGLFDYADLNAFLTLAATRHTLPLCSINGDLRRDKIEEAAKAGAVPVHLLSNLSDKNPLVILDHGATIMSLLEVFARGQHRVLIRNPNTSSECLGMVSDRGLLAWLSTYAKSTPSFKDYLSNTLQALSLPSYNAYSSVIAAFSSASILDAMRLMSEEGVSSVAVLDDETGTLLSTVSVTDVGKLVVPSQSSQFLSTPLHQVISYIKHPDGSTDGADRYPVYSVSPNSQLLYTIDKILATNAHRVFVARESTLSSPVLGPAAVGNLCGIVSIVDILAHFAKLAGITNVDPTEMQRHRRKSSTSSSHSSGYLSRSRSSSLSATNVGRSPSVLTLSPSIHAPMDLSVSPVASIDSLIPVIVPERRRSMRASKTIPGTAASPG